jgi:beta-phosphoglucomutase
MINTIIFDLDGVLCDLCELHKKCFQEALKRIAGLEISDEYHEEHLNGLPTSIKLQKLGVSGRLAIDVANFKQELTLSKLEQLEEDIDLQETIANLAESYNIFCASNSIRKTVELVLTRLGVIKYFDGYFGNDDVFMAKPSPELYYKCMVRAGAKLDETLVIEDSPVGEQTIKNAEVHGLIIKDRTELTLDRVENRIKEID